MYGMVWYVFLLYGDLIVCSNKIYAAEDLSTGQRQSKVIYVVNPVPIGNSEPVDCSVVLTWSSVATGLGDHVKRIGPRTTGFSADA